MADDNKQPRQRRRESDVVLMELTQRIVENNNSVSAGLSLASENIQALAESQERVEDKVDDLYEQIVAIPDINEIKKKNDENNEILKKIDTSGLVALVNNLKKLVIAIIVAIAGSAAWMVFKDIIVFYVKQKTEGSLP